ncbi:MAG: hypothetical protein KKD25_08000 [Gammaproteobacteria bacterium]|jgi:hypothetical protein|nr:hypothetical protein [Gammaproteobacteria bacterium]MBU0770425.1 hypothetical protein [Gammaproteobacteria bacterium]MBU0855153.1 hypothetical protein [Gammaproteobacteria bacterium]MBU1847343.1 hypothetical protein [Gammaproteobacteria bacterium]
MSEDLIGRADSLMRRSRTFVAGQPAQAPSDDGIPLLTEVVDFDILAAQPEPEDRTEEITAAVTAQVTADVTERVTRQVTAQVRDDMQHATSDALTRHFADLPALIQSHIDAWCTDTLPTLVSIELQAALESALGAATRHAADRIREQAVLELGGTVATEIEARSLAVVGATLTLAPSEAPDHPL